MTVDNLIYVCIYKNLKKKLVSMNLENNKNKLTYGALGRSRNKCMVVDRGKRPWEVKWQ